MRSQIVVMLCVAVLAVSAGAAAETIATITVYTEPPELEIWVDGARVGVGYVVLFGPFDDYVEVTVKGKGYEDTANVVRSPTSRDGNLVIVIAGEKKRGFSWGSLGIGFATGLGILGLMWG